MVIISASLFIGILLSIFVELYSKLVIANFLIKLSYLFIVVLTSIITYIVLISFYKPFSYDSLKLEFLKND